MPLCFYLSKKITSLIKTGTILIDLKLIEECRGGNLMNFRKLVEATSPFTFSVAFRLLGDEEHARDVVQETMVTVWQKIERIKSAEVYRTWIYRIVVNKCYDELRRRKRNPEFIPDEKAWTYISDTIADKTDSNLENKEIAGIISLLTTRLSPKQKMVFVLSDIEQLNGDEISTVTGMNKLQVKANLYYARKNISEMIEKYL
jgi:RNA polymerase sigma-70 factor (ECF subfamily)